MGHLGHKGNKLLIVFFAVAAILIWLTTAAAAQYENCEFLKANRSAGANVTLGQSQIITYSAFGEKFDVAAEEDKEKEIALVLDVSGSMGTALKDADGKNSTRIEVLKKAAVGFLDKFKTDSKTKICIIPYSSTANNLGVLLQVSANYTSLKSKISALSANGRTNMGDGLRRAYYLLKNGKTDAKKYVVLMTDGEPTAWSLLDTQGPTVEKDGGFPYNPAEQYKTADGNTLYYKGASSYQQNALEYAQLFGKKNVDEHFTTFAIGFTDVVGGNNHLEDVAVSSGCSDVGGGKHYYQANTAGVLTSIFDKIGKQIKEEYPFGNATFSELLPAGVQVVEDKLPAGFKAVDESGRIRVSGPLNNFSLRKGADGKYQVGTETFTLMVRYNVLGPKKFSGAKIDYMDPFGNAKTANFNDISISVGSMIDIN